MVDTPPISASKSGTAKSPVRAAGEVKPSGMGKVFAAHLKSLDALDPHVEDLVKHVHEVARGGGSQEGIRALGQISGQLNPNLGSVDHMLGSGVSDKVSRYVMSTLDMLTDHGGKPAEMVPKLKQFISSADLDGMEHYVNGILANGYAPRVTVDMVDRATRPVKEKILKSYGLKPEHGGTSRGVVLLTLEKLNPEQAEKIVAGLQEEFPKAVLSIANDGKLRVDTLGRQMISHDEISHAVRKVMGEHAGMFPGWVKPEVVETLMHEPAAQAELRQVVQKAEGARGMAGAVIAGVGAAVAAVTLFNMMGRRKEAAVAFAPEADTKLGAVSGPAVPKDRLWAAEVKTPAADAGRGTP